MTQPGRSSQKQWAYAQNKLAGRASTKHELALLSGFSPATAKKVKEKIESKQGYKNAMVELARQSNNILVKVLHEFDKRDLTEFSNKEIIGAVKAITDSWAKIDTQKKESLDKDPEKNPLRALYVQRSGIQKPKRANVIQMIPEVPNERIFNDAGEAQTK